MRGRKLLDQSLLSIRKEAGTLVFLLEYCHGDYSLVRLMSRSSSAIVLSESRTVNVYNDIKEELTAESRRMILLRTHGARRGCSSNDA